MLEAGQRGPALKNRLVGDASMCKGLHDIQTLRFEDGVKYLKNTLRPHLIKRAQSVFLWRLYHVIRARSENVEIVKWISKLSLLLKRLKDAWMDMQPTSFMGETRRQSQYHADVGRENEERRRSQELLNPDLHEARERWNGTQMASHEALFPFFDNLTTLMFVVANDLSGAQRERLESSLSLQGVEVTAYTLEAARTVFVDLFCTPKSSMENPSLRVNKYDIQAEPSS